MVDGKVCIFKFDHTKVPTLNGNGQHALPLCA